MKALPTGSDPGQFLDADHAPQQSSLWCLPGAHVALVAT